jgi:hypothetical protein
VANPVIEERYMDPPIITLHSPSNQTYTNTVLLNFTVKPSGSWTGQELLSVNYYIDGKYGWAPVGEHNDLSTPFNHYLYLTNLSDGVHSIEVFAQATGLIINRISGSFDRPLLDWVSSGNVYFTLDTNPPRISFLSQKKVYETSDFHLNFTVDQSASKIAYVLDEQDNVTILGNTTLSGLSSGLHNVRVYAWDNAGNIGASETISFTIAEEPEPFPTLLVASASGASIIGVAVCVFYYRKKRNH